MRNQTLTAIPGLLAGHATDVENGTGCTLILCPEGFTPGISVPGFAPGTRETDLMRPEALVDAVHGILLPGGSAFGLAAADGVMRWLRERDYGYATRCGNVPLVPGAVIYDLDTNRKPGLLPDAGMGYAAALAADTNPVIQGRVGAGTGARCGRLFGLEDLARTSPGGVGSALVAWRGIQVGALVVVNALGDVYDPDTRKWLAGGVDRHGQPFSREAGLAVLAGGAVPESNTVLAVVATNAPLDKTRTSRLARMAGAGLARVIEPAHLTVDGDVVFALSSKRPLPDGGQDWTDNLLGALGARAVACAAANAVR
ncbi:MAG: P1 family peptidase [Deltaproteobacteria bacterium]|jgi:L-aminopeptidase/D-esterase-like protein|nr:P1 family peptidase [Deltaproteobacteria bacterium]